MGHSRKHQHRLPSIIDSDMDHSDHSSLHDNDSSGSDSQSNTVLVPTDHLTGTGAVTGKHSKAGRKTINKTQDPTAPIPKLDYILTLFSATEMKKSAAKREPKKSSLQLSANEPWDTVKAQILVKIDEVLKPSTLSINNYEVLLTIPRVVSKPGYPLASATDYSILLGTYCFVNNEGMHLPLSHERLDCWAAAMASFFFFLSLCVSVGYNVASFLPEFPDAVESHSRDVTAIENVRESEEVTLMKLDRC